MSETGVTEGKIRVILVPRAPVVPVPGDFVLSPAVKFSKLEQTYK